VLNKPASVAGKTAALWAGLLSLPLLGLGLLRAQPALDATWEHHPSHFWLVLAEAGIAFAIGALMSEAARRRADARLFLVSLAFLSSAGFLGLHALATPGVLLEASNAGFVIATPVGLLVAAVFAAASALDLDPGRSARVMAAQGVLRGGLLLLLAAWAVVSLAGVPPLDEPLPPDRAEGPLGVLAVFGVALYGWAALRYIGLYRRTRSLLVIAVATAFALLAEAMIAVALARNWHLSWWEWHLLMAVAFGLVAYCARLEYRHRAAGGTFAGLYLEHTLGRADREYAAAVEELAAELRDGREPQVDEIAARFGLSGEQADVVERAAAQMAQIDGLFRQYVSPQVADRLRREGGLPASEEREVSILFADLEGYTAFTERSSPDEVIEMLNEYYGVVVPVVLRDEEGTIDKFVGDAVMCTFNAALDQPDHALRAARAGLAIQRRTERIAAARPSWPRFRVGVNTGRVIVAVVGGPEQRNLASVGDPVNVAARLQTAAEPGTVLIGPSTYRSIQDVAVCESLGQLRLKGRRQPVDAYVLRGLSDDRWSMEGAPG
jgi:adenylate cyclase